MNESLKLKILCSAKGPSEGHNLLDSSTTGTVPSQETRKLTLVQIVRCFHDYSELKRLYVVSNQSFSRLKCRATCSGQIPQSKTEFNAKKSREIFAFMHLTLTRNGSQ